MVSIFDRTKTDAEQGLCRFDRTSVTNHMSKVWRILMWQNWIKSKTGTFDLISQHKESSNFWLLKPQRSYPATVGGLWDPEIIESPLHHFSLIHLCDPCFFHIEPQSVQSVTFQIQLSSLQCPSSTQDRTFLSFQHWLQNGLFIEPNCNPCYKPKKISGFRWNLYLSGFEKGRTIITLTVKVPHNELLSFHYPVEHFEPLLFYTFLPIAMLNPK